MRTRKERGPDRETERRLAAVEQRVEGIAQRVRSQRDRLDRQRAELDEIGAAARRAPDLLEVLAAQVGAMQERLEDLAGRVEEPRYDATDTEHEEARRLVEEVRDEHRRLRVKMGVVVSYEERLRRVESALSEEMAAAAALAREAAEGGLLLSNAPADGHVHVAAGG